MGRPKKIVDTNDLYITAEESTSTRVIKSVRFHHAVPIGSGYEMVNGVSNGAAVGREIVEVLLDVDERFILIRTGKQEVLCPMVNVAAIHLEEAK